MWINAGILFNGPLGTNFSEILVAINTFSFRKMHFKMSSQKWRSFCLSLNVLCKHVLPVTTQQITCCCSHKSITDKHGIPQYLVSGNLFVAFISIPLKVLPLILRWGNKKSPRGQWVNSPPPSAAYMCQWIVSALVQIMACRLDGAKPLSEPMLTYCQLDPKEHISMKFHLKLKYFHSRKCICTCLWNGGQFVLSEMS